MKKIIIKSVILLALFFATGVLCAKSGLPTVITESAEETKEEIAQPDNENGMFIPESYQVNLPGTICILNYAESTIHLSTSGIFQPPRQSCINIA